MKAVYLTEHGDTDVLTYGDLPEPEGARTTSKCAWRLRPEPLDSTRARAARHTHTLQWPHVWAETSPATWSR